MKKRIDRLTMVAKRLQVQSFCLQHVCKLKKEFNACKQAAIKGSNLVKQK